MEKKKNFRLPAMHACGVVLAKKNRSKYVKTKESGHLGIFNTSNGHFTLSAEQHENSGIFSTSSGHATLSDEQHENSHSIPACSFDFVQTTAHMLYVDSGQQNRCKHGCGFLPHTIDAGALVHQTLAK